MAVRASWIARNHQVAENSLEAFRRAVEAGYGMELDVQLTADDQLVVFHDKSLKRVCGVDKDLYTQTYAQLQEFPLPDGSKIKYHDRIAQTCEAAYEQLRRYKGAYCVESFHPLAVRWFRQHAPEVVRGELASGGKWKPGELNRFEHFAMKYLLPLCLTRPHFVAYCAAEDGNLSMWLEKKLFRPYLAAWTIRDQKLMDRVQKEYDYPIFELFTPKEKQ